MLKLYFFETFAENTIHGINKTRRHFPDIKNFLLFEIVIIKSCSVIYFDVLNKCRTMYINILKIKAR